MRRRTLLWIALTMCAGLAASGCRGDEPKTEAASAPRAAPRSVDGAADDVDVTEPSPLEAFLGTADPRVMNKRVAEVDRLRQEHMVGCMRDKGWEYEPIDFSGANDPSSGAAAQGANLPEDEYLQRYGYGFTETLSASQVPVGTIDDPNLDREAKLTGANADAYFQAKAGCFDSAAKKFADPTVTPRELRDDIEELRKQIASDPRVIDATRRWSSCMAEAGFHFENRQEIFAELERRVAPVREAAESGPRGRPASAVDGFEEVRRYELSVATADVHCKANLDRVTRLVTNEVEQRYIEANGDRIAVLRGEG